MTLSHDVKLNNGAGNVTGLYTYVDLAKFAERSNDTTIPKSNTTCPPTIGIRSIVQASPDSKKNFTVSFTDLSIGADKCSATSEEVTKLVLTQETTQAANASDSSEKASFYSFAGEIPDKALKCGNTKFSASQVSFQDTGVTFSVLEFASSLVDSVQGAVGGLFGLALDRHVTPSFRLALLESMKMLHRQELDSTLREKTTVETPQAVPRYTYMLTYKPENSGENCQYMTDVDAKELNKLYAKLSGQNVTEETEESRSCFPSGAKVQLENGSFARMDDLQVGDSVRVGQNEFSKVLLFTHANPDVRSRFVRITTAEGASVVLSPGHYLPMNGGLTAAQKVRVGDKLSVLKDGREVQSMVTSTSAVSLTGLFNPQTATGKIAVQWDRDAVMASTYTTAVHPVVAHMLLTPLRVLESVVGLTIPGLSRMFTDGSAFWTALLPPGSNY